MNQLVFVPVSRETARRIAGGEALTAVPAFTANAMLAESFGIADLKSEEAEFAALTLASLAALTGYGERLVLVAELAADACRTSWEAEAANGGISLAGIPARAVVAFFADLDAPQTHNLVQRAAVAAKGMVIDAAWELPEVAVLIEQADLLWHDITELAAYLG